MSSANTNLYQNRSKQFTIESLERATLIENIILPKITTQTVTLGFLESGGSIILAQNAYKDMVGKFSVKMLNPMAETDTASDSNTNSPKKIGLRGQNMNTNSYTTSNFVSLIIPKHIVLGFAGQTMIPKGTEFIVGFVGNEIEIENIQVLGVYKQNQ